MKRFFSLILVVALLIGVMCPSAFASVYAKTFRVVNCESWVSLREYPSTDSARLTKIPLGATVSGTYYNSSFTECYYNGMWGYVLSQYLMETPSYHYSDPYYYNDPYYYSDYYGLARVINCNESVSLRSSPSTSASKLANVPLGAYVEAYYYNDDFAHCCYNGMWGYILRGYLDMPGTSHTYSAGSYLGARYVANCEEWVSLRSSPSTSAPRIMTVPLGAKVQAYYYNSEFCKCLYKGEWGYILSKYLEK